MNWILIIAAVGVFVLVMLVLAGFIAFEIETSRWEQGE